MEVHFLGWLGLAVCVLALITFDIVGHVRNPHVPALKETVTWSLGYLSLGVAFGFIVWAVWGLDFATQYWAGFITEQSLSIDNMFVFIIIMTSFRVPRVYQQKALLSGIIIALVLRLIFILIGAALVERFTWIFFFFGAWLLWTAFSQARQGVQKPEDFENEEYHENSFVRRMRRILPVSDGFRGARFFYRHSGKTYVTPLFLVVFALGTADLMFAFDSIPAIFGLTSQAYLVFASNAFALLGLRQLYFLIDSLLERLMFLHYGLAIILGFIGVKLVLHALHDNTVPFINGGQAISGVPEVGTVASLLVILGTLVVTVTASLIGAKKKNRTSAPANSQQEHVERGTDA